MAINPRVFTDRLSAEIPHTVFRFADLNGLVATAYHLQMSFMAGNLSEETIDTLTSRLENSGPASAGWPRGWTEEDSKALKDQCQPGGRGPWHLLPFNFA